MTEINIHGLSTDELVTLIRRASAELANRFPSGADKSQGAPQKSPDPATQEMQRPSDDDADFVLRIKSKILRGDYIKADERRRVAAIAQEFPKWVKRQQLPTDSGTGDWKKAGQYFSTPIAKER